MRPVRSVHPPGVACYLSGELARYAWSLQCYNRILAPSGSANVWSDGALISRNVNSTLTYALKDPKFRWVWIMGDDHTYPQDILLKLLDRDKDVVVPLCPSRTPPIAPCIQRASEERNLNWDELPKRGLYKLRPDETCGDAGMLMRRNVLEALGPTFYKKLISGAWQSEDRYFSSRIRRKGFDLYIDLDNPIGHLTPIELIPQLGEDREWDVVANAHGKTMTRFRSAPARKSGAGPTFFPKSAPDGIAILEPTPRSDEAPS